MQITKYYVYGSRQLLVFKIPIISRAATVDFFFFFFSINLHIRFTVYQLTVLSIKCQNNKEILITNSQSSNVHLPFTNESKQQKTL